MNSFLHTFFYSFLLFSFLNMICLFVFFFCLFRELQSCIYNRSIMTNHSTKNRIVQSSKSNIYFIYSSEKKRKTCFFLVEFESFFFPYNKNVGVQYYIHILFCIESVCIFFFFFYFGVVLVCMVFFRSDE